MNGKAKIRFRTVSYVRADTCYLLLVGLLSDSQFPVLGLKNPNTPPPRVLTASSHKEDVTLAVPGKDCCKATNKAL